MSLVERLGAQGLRSLQLADELVTFLGESTSVLRERAWTAGVGDVLADGGELAGIALGARNSLDATEHGRALASLIDVFDPRMNMFAPPAGSLIDDVRSAVWHLRSSLDSSSARFARAASEPLDYGFGGAWEGLRGSTSQAADAVSTLRRFMSHAKRHA